MKPKAVVYLCAYNDETHQSLINQEAICNKRAEERQVEIVTVFKDQWLCKNHSPCMGLMDAMSLLEKEQWSENAIDYLLIADLERLGDTKKLGRYLWIIAEIGQYDVSTINTSTNELFWLKNATDKDDPSFYGQWM